MKADELSLALAWYSANMLGDHSGMAPLFEASLYRAVGSFVGAKPRTEVTPEMLVATLDAKAGPALLPRPAGMPLNHPDVGRVYAP